MDLEVFGRWVNNGGIEFSSGRRHENKLFKMVEKTAKTLFLKVWVATEPGKPFALLGIKKECLKSLRSVTNLSKEPGKINDK